MSTEMNSNNEKIVYIGLGSNLDSPVAQIAKALESLAELPATRCITWSRFYRSTPMQMPVAPILQADYINAVAALATHLNAHTLLLSLQGIERRQGRTHGPVRWGARTIDLDLLLYGDMVLTGEPLTVPHPGMHQRDFVLYPLYEIAGDVVIPGQGKLLNLLAKCHSHGLRPLVGVQYTEEPVENIQKLIRKKSASNVY